MNTESLIKVDSDPFSKVPPASKDSFLVIKDTNHNPIGIIRCVYPLNYVNCLLYQVGVYLIKDTLGRLV